MVGFHLMRFFIWVHLSISFFVVFGTFSWCPHHFIEQKDQVFEQKTDKFWKFDEQSNSWVEVDLPFDLLSCVNENCTKVGRIEKSEKKEESPEQGEDSKGKGGLGANGAVSNESSEMVLRRRKRISLTRMSDTSIWVTGESGSIYERFWNGMNWVIAPHDLPISAGAAVSIFLVSRTILALSEVGNLYQLQLTENSQPVWVELMPEFESNADSKEQKTRSRVHIKNGVTSYDEERVYFSTKNGSLLELSEVDPPRWIDHGHPPGGNVVAIADPATIRRDVVFTVSSAGDLYEFDRNSKPSWKKHIWREESVKQTSLAPSKACTFHGLVGIHSVSLFLLTTAGNLVERRLHQRKWKWIVHGNPGHHQLTTMTSIIQDELNNKIMSLFITTATGSVFQYKLLKQSGATKGSEIEETWVNHIHPPQARSAKDIPGLQFQNGRIMFALDDGRLAELHLSGIGGEGSGPTHPNNVRRKTSNNYEWSVLDAPETEGWNAEYCKEERGPFNCIAGVKDETSGLDSSRPTTRRKVRKNQENYLEQSAPDGSLDEPLDQDNSLENGIFHMRVMAAGRSFFLITDDGLTFEYIYAENIWLWLRHEHETTMKGVLGNYNGSLFLVDTHGNLLIRERNDNELLWINCTSMRKGRQVISGPPWDSIPGKAQKVTTEDAIFFISKHGRLVQFTVFMRKFKWKDCRNPPNTRIACIVDQELFRDNIVFVMGRNGRLYQYNKVTELWHEHYQSPHLVLSKLPGTALRLSSTSLSGSIFMVAEDGGLIEYHWDSLDEWRWVEHGTPDRSVCLVGAPGPSPESNQLFVIGSDGEVYLRYLDQRTWRWKSFGFPHLENMLGKDHRNMASEDGNNKICVNREMSGNPCKNCDSKVAPVRPIPFSKDIMIFELRDGRLAELQKVDDLQWEWSRAISTPTTKCVD
ncbi:hypothetical protein Sjap_002301 [Stephania japonica]|uniref:Uncharacterized protein n=1 Tax=Stephania japonica TaxID=461633 RepID=A0AAP0KLL9_9MAGN